MKSTVVIVDDCKALHDLVAASLADDGYIIDHAYDGASGLAMVRAMRPQLVLLDLDLPDLNGIEVCQQLKGNPATAGIGVIFLTVSGSADDRVRGLQLSPADYVVKPFDPRELSLRVRMALRTIHMANLLEHAGLGVRDATDIMGSHGIPKLCLWQMIQARSQNPWHRISPSKTLKIVPPV